jgi:hypothetical protein
VTGQTDPQAAAETVLSRPNTSTEWCVVKMGGEGAVLVTKAGEVHHAPAFKVSTKGHPTMAWCCAIAGRQGAGQCMAARWYVVLL